MEIFDKSFTHFCLELMYSTCEHQPFYRKFHNVAKISKHLLQIQKNCKMSPDMYMVQIVAINIYKDVKIFHFIFC
jgi:hypothetical protein